MPDKIKVVSLKNYIDENKDILTIFGVFLAIAAFAGNLGVKLVAAFISISAVTCATFVAIEIWRQAPKGKPSATLTLFRVALFALTLSLLVYCIYFLDGIDPDIIFPISTVLFFEISILIIKWLSKRITKVERAVEWFKGRAKIWKIVIAIPAFIGTMFLGRLVTNRIEAPVFKAVIWIATVSSKIQGPIQ